MQARSRVQNTVAQLPNQQIRAVRQALAEDLAKDIAERDVLLAQEQAVQAEVQSKTKDALVRIGAAVIPRVETFQSFAASPQAASERRALEDERSAVDKRLAELKLLRRAQTDGDIGDDAVQKLLGADAGARLGVCSVSLSSCRDFWAGRSTHSLLHLVLIFLFSQALVSRFKTGFS